jgi:putative SOS response-associated peptidase YedK
MCGRYTLSATPSRISTRFSVAIESPHQPSYNIAPGGTVLIVFEQAGDRRCGNAYWGFTPAWVKPGARAPRPINARSEGVANKPMFRQAFARRRCLLPADGFYEWQVLGRGKQPWLIRLRDGDVFAFAGIYEPANELAGNMPSCAILTTGANPLMQPIHQRMPVIVEPDDYDRWLDPTPPDSGIEQLLRPYQRDDMLAYPVSARVNSARHDDEGLIEPLQPA